MPTMKLRKVKKAFNNFPFGTDRYSYALSHFFVSIHICRRIC